MAFIGIDLRGRCRASNATSCRHTSMSEPSASAASEAPRMPSLDGARRRHDPWLEIGRAHV